ncbi:MAG: MmgE/PrpD family protein [Rhodospirillales bacterium]|nr:MmgE/PrpD family protein [Rhodospirillales bacterium]
MSAAARFASHALDTRFADLPAVAVERAKVFVLDSLGVGIAGSSVEGAEGLLRVTAGWGAPAVPVWGRAARLSAPTAAFMNAWQMHNQEYDGLHEGAVVHAMATVLPASLAAAEMRGGASGAELIAAIAVGVDIAAGLGLASRAGFRFFRPGTAGGFGATAAAARLLGLDKEALQAAFAWQLAQASGTMQAHVEGSPVLPAQLAFNARAAVQSCELARLGFATPDAVFEGPFGYLALFEGEPAPAPVLESLGRDWRIAEFSHKPFPAGRATHGGIEGVMALQQKHGFMAADVAAVEISAPPLIVRLVGRPARPDAGASYTRLCMAWAVARVLQNAVLDLADFRGASLDDPATQELARRVSVTNDGNVDPNALVPQHVVVRLRNGNELAWSCEAMLANPARPLTTEQHLAKFRRCVEFSATPLPPDTSARLIETVDRLEALEDVRLLGTLAAPDTSRPPTG